MTDAELKRAFEIYNEDMKKAENVIIINNIQLSCFDFQIWSR